MLWAGRVAINPVHRIADPGEWQVHDGPEEPRATHSSTGARLQTDGDQVVLSVPIAGVWIDIRFSVPASTIDGGIPVIRTKDAIEAMRSVLAIAAGADGPETLPRVHNGTATVTVQWDPERVADHTGVTATFATLLAPTLTTVPDALVGRCWPAVFAAIGSAVTGAGVPVVEGLLSLVHLDHAAHLVAALPTVPAELTVTATASVATDSEVGRVVPISVTVAAADRTVLATLEERFAIRGRTGAAESDRPAAGRWRGLRERHRHPTASQAGRHAYRAGRHAAVRGGVGRSQPDSHRSGRCTAGRSGFADRARNVVVGRGATCGDRHRRPGPTSGPVGRLDGPLPGHGTSR